MPQLYKHVEVPSAFIPDHFTWNIITARLKQTTIREAQLYAQHNKKNLGLKT